MAKTNPTSSEVIAAAKKLGRPIESNQGKPLAVYLDQLIKWNKKMNLVGPTNWPTVFKTLVVDSLHLADFLTSMELSKDNLTLDLGAGAGLPGIPLRAIWQKGEYWLVESRERRTLFMRSVVGKIHLPGTHVFEGRAEEVLDHIRETQPDAMADLILSRAFMPWLKLLDFVRPMLRENGTVVILANTPPPKPEELPEGWQLESEADYAAAGKTRYFWSLKMVA